MDYYMESSHTHSLVVAAELVHFHTGLNLVVDEGREGEETQFASK